jgi:hypothetical protein
MTIDHICPFQNLLILSLYFRNTFGLWQLAQPVGGANEPRKKGNTLFCFVHYSLLSTKEMPLPFEFCTQAQLQNQNWWWLYLVPFPSIVLFYFFSYHEIVKITSLYSIALDMVQMSNNMNR